jgi:hypothetical protein
VALLLIVAVGAVLRAWPIPTWPLELDEALTLRHARVDPGLFLTWDHHAHHAPLGYALVRAAMAVFRTDAEWALRLPSTIAGVLCIPAAFLLGRLTHGTWAAILLAALVALDPTLIHQSVHARMYALLALEFFVVLILLVASMSGTGNRKGLWFALGLSMAAAVWTHALGLVLWLGVLASAGLRFHDRSVRTGAAIAFAVALATSAIGLFPKWQAAGQSIRFRSSPVAGPADQLAITLRRIGDVYPIDWVGPLLVILGLGGLLLLRRRSTPAATALLVIAIASVSFGLMAARLRPFGLDRYLLFFRLAVHVGLAVALIQLRPRAVRSIGIASILLLALGLGVAAYPRRLPPDHAVGAVVRALSRHHFVPGQVVAYEPGNLYFLGEYYGLPTTFEVGPRAAAVPDGYDYPLTWVVFGHGDALHTHVPGLREELSPHVHVVAWKLAEYYGAPYDERMVEERLLADGTLAIGMDRGRIHVLTLDEALRSR